MLPILLLSLLLRLCRRQGPLQGGGGGLAGKVHGDGTGPPGAPGPPGSRVAAGFGFLSFALNFFSFFLVGDFYPSDRDTREQESGSQGILIIQDSPEKVLYLKFVATYHLWLVS